MKFSYDWLFDNQIDCHSERDDLLVFDEGTSRWYQFYSLVFKYEGKWYHVNYQKGLTEYQDLSGDEHFQDMYDKEVDCPEVEVYEETTVIKKWRAIKE